MNSELLSIGKAAQYLGISIDTLRRWDADGILPSVRAGETAHRYYRRQDLENYISDRGDIARSMKLWCESAQPAEPAPQYYCQTRDAFQARLDRLHFELKRIDGIDKVSEITAAIGEIGNNAFDHNLGNWPDISGIFFAYDTVNRIVVLADRGRGLRATLERVRPSIQNHLDALQTAFTEVVSGRAPEARGNGLKYVKTAVMHRGAHLMYCSGDSCLTINGKDHSLTYAQNPSSFHGCHAVLYY